MANEKDIAEFVYTGDKIRLDIQLIVKHIEAEANRLLDEVDLYVLEALRNGYSKDDIGLTIEAFLRGGKDIETVKGLSETFSIEPLRTIFKPFYSRQKRLIDELTSQMVAKPVNEFEKDHPGTKYFWILGSVKTSHCPDCLKLASISEGEGAKTIDEWREYGYGLPREGGTECSVGCKCMLQAATDEELAKAVEKEFDKYVYNDITKNNYKSIEDEKWIESLTEGELKAVTYYCEDEYTVMNNYLRGQATKETMTASEFERMNDLKKALNRSTLKKDSIFYRAIDIDNMPNINLSTGLSFKDDGFCSATIELKTAKEYVASMGMKKPAFFQVYAKEGTKGGAVKFASRFGDEYEFLFANGTEFEIFEQRTIEVIKSNKRKVNAVVYSVRVK